MGDLLLVVGVWVGIGLLMSLPQMISTASSKHKEKVRDEAANDLFKELAIKPELLLAESKEKLTKFETNNYTQIKDQHLNWDQDPDWINNVEFRKQFLGGFYSAKRYDSLERKCPSCDVGYLRVKNGQYGKFIGCSNYPKCEYTQSLAIAKENYEKKINKDFLENLKKAYL
ncbi:MAG: topoisomerase DNA-binding C4 zinc finger domain-containing protein [Patescibacteria group bacterium]